jgi:hypothetical protein
MHGHVPCGRATAPLQPAIQFCLPNVAQITVHVEQNACHWCYRCHRLWQVPLQRRMRCQPSLTRIHQHSLPASQTHTSGETRNTWQTVLNSTAHRLLRLNCCSSRCIAAIGCCPLSSWLPGQFSLRQYSARPPRTAHHPDQGSACTLSCCYCCCCYLGLFYAEGRHACHALFSSNINAESINLISKMHDM